VKRWIVTAALAALGLAALGPLVDLFDLSNTWHLRLTRDDAVKEARRLARSHGVNADDWAPLVRAGETENRAYWERKTRRPVHPLVTSAHYEVSLLAPGGRRWVKVMLTADGRPSSLTQNFASGEAPAANRVEAAALLALYAVPFERSFRRENESVAQGEGTVDSWIWVAPNPQEASIRFEVLTERGALKEARLTPQLPADFLERLRKTRTAQTAPQQALVTVAITVAFGAAFPLFFRGLVRRRFPSRLLWRVWLLFLVPGLATVWMQMPVSDAFTARETFSTIAAQLVNGVVGWLVLAGAFVLFYGAGRTLLDDVDLRRWFTFEALAQGKIWSRQLGVSLAGGVLAGCALAVLPFVGLVFGPPAHPHLATARSAMTAWPALTFLRQEAFNETALLLLLVLPWRHRLRRPWGWLVYLAMGICLPGVLRDLYDFHMGPNLLAGAAIALGVAAVYFSFDLLAALVAHGVMGLLPLAVAMSFQPAGLRMDALTVVTLPALLLVAGLVLMWRGEAVDVEAETARQKAELREAASDRDRLRAEFSVARKAQLGMLPDVPERIGATTLAALCHPAREVGGDLYDFFRCADGRYAICVADVSGKGVPASLYMAMTKGILAAASVESTAIAELMGTLNKHLLAFGKRRMFVTMALGYYDPETRVLEHARAGHNPTLVWSAREGKAEFLRPRGVGLGLAGVTSFNRTLQVERVTLEPDDVVVFYSDGIVEAMNMAKDQFTEERLVEAVRENARLSAGAIAEEIERRVRLFAGAAPVHDDQTLFVMRVG
jgi:serine phosphatase RsbU (regulator of sigma subunit)